MIDPTFRNINRWLVLLLKNGKCDPIRGSFDKYYMPLVEFKVFIALIDNKPLFDQPEKNKHEAYEKLAEMSSNDDYTTGHLLDYLYHQKYYKPIGIDLLKQTNTTIPWQINFIGNLEDNNGATMFIITENLQNPILGFPLDSLKLTK